MSGRLFTKPAVFVVVFLSVALFIGLLGGLRTPVSETSVRPDVCTYPGHELCPVERDSSCDVGIHFCLPHQYGWSACQLAAE